MGSNALTQANADDYTCELWRAMRAACKKNGVDPGAMMATLDTSNGFLFVADDGLVVLSVIVRDGKMGVLVFLAWSRSRNGIAAYHDEIERICRWSGAEFIEFWSTRKGFNRVAPQLGYNLHNTRNNLHCWRKPLWVAATQT